MKKKYRFFHQVPGRPEKMYHLDTCCTVSADPAAAKVYNMTESEARDQQKIIRGNFEYVFEDARYAAHECWYGQPVAAITTSYEEVPAKKDERKAA